MANLVFTSKIDFWIAAILFGAILLTIAAPFWQWKRNGDGSLAQSIFLAFMLLPFIALTLLPLFRTKYTLTESQLLINNGFFTQRIEIAKITKITPTRNMKSSPALSLDRIKISYQGNSVLISPKDKPLFLQEIQARNPNIAVEY
ncbi:MULTISPECIES: PH domain-containing protein [Psychrobacter]|uniref:PH domain-containing protein n=1 Tax=Psychrobacter TaxID=497 RepID=UPI00146BBBD0|nr:MULTISPECIES: PH domain-containing protein [Psychrobacter]